MRRLKKAGLTLLIASMFLSNSTFYAFADVVSSEQTAGLTEVVPTGSASEIVPAPGSVVISPETDPNQNLQPETTPEVIVEAIAEASVEEAPEVSVEAAPEASVEAAPEASVEATPEVSAEIPTEVVQDPATLRFANAESGPLSVPHRTPRLQTTILLGETMQWSDPMVNDTPVTVGDRPFQSISTYLEGIHGDLLYRTYTTSCGWTGWVMNGQQTSVASNWAPIEAIQFRFAGPVANQYDIYYTASISDGSYTSWAMNGTTCGTMNQGNYMTGFRLMFYEKGTAPEMDLSRPMFSPHYDGVQYIDGQLRYIHADGSNFTGWGWMDGNYYYFADSYPVTGWQYLGGYKYYFGEDGKLWTDVESIIGTAGPFQIKINKEMNCLTVYAQDGANGYIIPVKSFLVSTGDDTPLGTFKTPEKYRWRLMINDVWTQYATRLGSGLSILMHSIIYDAPDPYTVWASTYNNLGIARSAGCIRLTTADSKWIYDHCATGTTVIVYEDPIPGPFDRPTIEAEIPFEQRWDPTDPSLTQEGINAKAQEIQAAFGY